MTPITSLATPEQRRYNRAFLKVRQTIECTFGIWKSRWRSMDKTGGTLCYSPEKCCRIIITTMVLHNMCINHCLLNELETSMNEPTLDTDSHQEPSENGILMEEIIVTEFYLK